MTPLFLNSNQSLIKLLIVDDEPDIHIITKMSLDDLTYAGKEVELLSADSGEEALSILRSSPDIAVVLLDVVMENDHAGLDTCRSVREDLKNSFVRILLRTGQPGMAPEKSTITDYDIDDYIPKAGMDDNRLYTSVRTAIKAWTELVELESHRYLLSIIHDCAVSLRSDLPLTEALSNVLDTVLAIVPSSLTLLHLETFEENGDPQRVFLHMSDNPDQVLGATIAQEKYAAILVDRSTHDSKDIHPFENGLIIPFAIHHELGYGWIYIDEQPSDKIILQSISQLIAHATNALYGSVALRLVKAREAFQGDSIDI